MGGSGIEDTDLDIQFRKEDFSADKRGKSIQSKRR